MSKRLSKLACTKPRTSPRPRQLQGYVSPSTSAQRGRCHDKCRRNSVHISDVMVSAILWDCVSRMATPGVEKIFTYLCTPAQVVTYHEQRHFEHFSYSCLSDDQVIMTQSLAVLRFEKRNRTTLFSRKNSEEKHRFVLSFINKGAIFQTHRVRASVGLSLMPPNVLLMKKHIIRAASRSTRQYRLSFKPGNEHINTSH